MVQSSSPSISPFFNHRLHLSNLRNRIANGHNCFGHKKIVFLLVVLFCSFIPPKVNFYSRSFFFLCHHRFVPYYANCKLFIFPRLFRFGWFSLSARVSRMKLSDATSWFLKCRDGKFFFIFVSFTDFIKQLVFNRF